MPEVRAPGRRREATTLTRLPTPGRAGARTSTPRSASSSLLLGVLERLARISPVVVIVEDLHWADPSTRQTSVAFLVRNLRSERVLLVATIRTDETGPDGGRSSRTSRSWSEGSGSTGWTSPDSTATTSRG